MTVEPFLATVGGEAGSRRIAALPGPDWLKALRRLALARAGALGLPTRHNEAWKYTDIAGLAAAGYQPAAPADGGTETGDVRLVNGYVAGLAGRLPKGVSLSRLTDPEVAPLVEPLLGHVLDHDDKPIAAFNTALFHEGVVLRIARGVAAERPIEVESLALGHGVEFHPRLLVVVEAGASATLVERHRGQGDTFATPVTEIVLEEGASLRHYTLEDEGLNAVHLATLGVRLEAGARYQGVVLQIGGRLARHEVHADLNGPEASFDLKGATLGGGNQHLDLTTFVCHRAPHCQSHQVFKTVLDGHARGVALGKITVEPNAQKTDGYQLSRALLLSPRAEMDGRPELEIYADDVKCGHGASIGALDEDALFYLRSRAIDEATARRLLIAGFLAEATDRIDEADIRDEFAAVVTDRLDRIIALEAS